MIGQPSPRGWMLATALSLVVHGAAAGALIWRPSWNWADPAPQPEISVTTIALPSAGPEDAGEVLSPVIAPGPEPTPQVEETLTETLTAEPVTQTASPIIGDSALPMASTPEVPAEAPSAAPAADTPTDERLVELFDRIRSRVTASCLLALPALDGDGNIRLNLLASDDAQIPGLLRDLTEGLQTEVTGQPVVLDPRQCAGLTFARRDLRYPVFPLGIQLQSQDVASGASLRGTISGGAGRYVTLLLVDDNGVTHDLRRFLVNAGGRIHFDMPIARDGAGRDTNQLLLAIATPDRPDAVTAAAGELAEEFFDRLARDIGPEALIGVSSVYVR